MATLNDLQWQSWSTILGHGGQLNDLFVEYFKTLTGIDSNDPQDLWYAQLTLLGYTGAVQDMQFEYWGDLGYTGSWNDRYYAWLEGTGGTFGPAVFIVDNKDPSFCNFEPPTTTDCAASGTYTANDTGFTAPADTWLWTIEPPVAGVNLTDATLKTCTVSTDASAVDVAFNLKVVATDSVSTDTANRTTAFDQDRIDTNVAPVYIGPNIATQFVAQNAELGPIETFSLYTGTNLVFSLEGTWPANAIIGASTGTISGTIVDPVADYPNLTIRATNSKGFADSFPFTVTVLADEVAPVFDAGPVPAQVWQEGEVITQFPMSQYFGGTLPITYTIESGALPAGLTMNDAGQINGTPTTDGTGSIVVRATNGAGTDVTNDWGWTIWEAIQTTTIADQSFPLDELYTHDFSGDFTGTITSWVLGGTWPPGFAIDGNGVVTGTATVLDEVFAGLFITADNIYEVPVNSNTFTGTTQPAVTLPVFLALTPDETTFEMLGVAIGTGGLTTTHTATVYAADFEGLYQPFAADAAVWFGGRTVLNYCPDVASSGFATFNSSKTTGVSDPDGGNDAITYTATGGGSSLAANVNIFPHLNTVRNSIWLRRRTGVGQVRMLHGNATGATDITAFLTGSWQRFATDPIGSSQSNNSAAGLYITEIGDEVDMYKAQKEDVTGQTNQNPAEFIGPSAVINTVPLTTAFANLNANTVASFVVTEAVGALISPQPYLQFYTAAQNDQLWSNDLTNAAWFPTNMTVAQTQVGITGAPNTATLLTATAGNAIVIGTAVTAASANQTTKWYIKRVTGTGTIEITVDNAVSWVDVTADIDTLGFTAVTATKAALANPVIGIRIVTSGDEVTVGNAETHTASTLALVSGLGPIFTTTAPVATDATLYEFDYANQNDSSAAWYFEFLLSVPEAETSNDYVDLGTTGTARPLYYSSFTTQRCRGLSGDSDLIISSGPPIPHKGGTVYNLTDNQMTLAHDGLYGNNPGWTGFNTPTNLRVMANNGTVSKSCSMRNFRRYDITSYAEGRGIINELMAETITMTAGNAGQDVGYRTATFGTLVPDTAFGYTINEIVERFNDVTLIVDGIQTQNIFDTIQINGVVLDLAVADSFTTGAGVSTWTWDATAITLVSTTVYPVKVKTS